MIFATSLRLLAVSVSWVVAASINTQTTTIPTADNITTCNNQVYKYDTLAGYGKLPSNTRDKYGDTIGGIGSAIALEPKSWKLAGDSYTGVVYGLPDRGWNTQGTQNTQSRIHKFYVNFTPVEAKIEKPASPNLKIVYNDTILLYGPDSTPLTGLDATGRTQYPGFPDLPMAQYTGNGFGGEGDGGSRISLDSEGLVLKDGNFWISDEYAAYIYEFDPEGKMKSATPTPDAITPQRNGTDSFDADSPPIYDPTYTITPEDPTSGRSNNQGLEALTSSPDGEYIYTMLQSATVQDGGTSSKKRRNTRLFVYKNCNGTMKLEAEYAVQLPVLPNDKVAIQSEMHYISPTQFLVLAHDSNAGRGQKSSESLYRNVDVIDISKATNLVNQTGVNDVGGQIASSKGKLKKDIQPAEYCPWLSFNDNAQLGKFGLHNGGVQDVNLLNEKWESLALLPVDANDSIGRSAASSDDKSAAREFYLISLSDNDFITQDGYINGGQTRYADASGLDLDIQALVFKVKVPSAMSSTED
ncbi:Phytase-like domain containing protein [Pyrenophora tritici-repentis]|uniref:Esterase activity of phytase n=2 Tax=Pyrenophora tritici-repentis TaxID=45151 RepID=A0A2W1DBM9_9PLEO|nr:uncharacterized protein PTRG_08260 [Pyrenophora tritici-repentis Pt-1C-BFP]KAA8615802.1 Phytase domain-containing protein [Pyrenophora tritici-repentis]EDU51179.1 conserved hypothetical protein [Pyrenophora tritici-repentis Pt-1C-BFP]KAF7443608.1 Phytase domain containing protein [Pyrenophora tritici-repentis]KAF7566678.1 Phytase domain containing protein [Pyrenophora tritici-repentis]KAG9379346.1 Phytase domain containing protein [Pyrenophora tritici-repentis]